MNMKERRPAVRAPVVAADEEQEVEVSVVAPAVGAPAPEEGLPEGHAGSGDVQLLAKEVGKLEQKRQRLADLMALHAQEREAPNAPATVTPAELSALTISIRDLEARLREAGAIS